MYLDTSVAVAIYTHEANSEALEAVLMGGDGYFSSELLRAEMMRALLVKEKSKVISPSLRAEILTKFGDHVADGMVQLIPLNDQLVNEAVELMTQVYPDVLLRTLDAIHLATYLSVDAGPLFTRDKRMLEAARKLGIALAE